MAYRPVGVVAAITGYNYPLNLGIFKWGAALAAGCTAVVLPSPRTPLTTLWLGDLTREAELPPGVLNFVIGGPEVGQHLSSHPGVDRVSFTGSDGVGVRIMQQAAAGLKGVTLELGGKSPNIVLEGVDVRSIAADVHLRWARNGGQGCAAGQGGAGPKDAVGPHHPDVELGDVHGAALAFAAPALAPVDLLHHPPGVDALGDAVAVAPVGGGDPVGWAEVHHDPGAGRLLAGVEVDEAGDVAPGEVDVEPFLELADGPHRPVGREQAVPVERELVVSHGFPSRGRNGRGRGGTDPGARRPACSRGRRCCGRRRTAA